MTRFLVSVEFHNHSFDVSMPINATDDGVRLFDVTANNCVLLDVQKEAWQHILMCVTRVRCRDSFITGRYTKNKVLYFIIWQLVKMLQKEMTNIIMK